MLVMKKDGRKQEFNIDKVALSIERASDHAKQPINGADKENISKSITKRLNALDSPVIPVEWIRDIVVAVLESYGFSTIAEYYKKGKSM